MDTPCWTRIEPSMILPRYKQNCDRHTLMDLNQPRPSLSNYSYKISVHTGDKVIGSFDQEVYRTAKTSLDTPFKK